MERQVIPSLALLLSLKSHEEEEESRAYGAGCIKKVRDEEAQAAEEYGSRREAEPGKTEPVSGKLLGRGEALIRGTR